MAALPVRGLDLFGGKTFRGDGMARRTDISVDLRAGLKSENVSQSNSERGPQTGTIVDVKIRLLRSSYESVEIFRVSTAYLMNGVFGAPCGVRLCVRVCLCGMDEALR